MKKFLRQFSTIFNPVTVNYQELVTGQNLFRKIEDGYSEDGLGLIAVNQIPWYQEKRMAALSYGRLLCNLPAGEKTKILRPEINYFYGWREGNEPILGKKNDFKYSFQGVLEHDKSETLNIWPSAALPGMQKAMNDFGNTITIVGHLLAKHLDQYVKVRNIHYKDNLLEDVMINNKDHVFRLLYYAPFGSNDDWISWHRDFGAITGLSCPIYINQKTGEILSENEHDDEHVGLFIKNRKGEIFKASLKSDSLIFQIGEAAQIITHGYLQATPHCVLSSESIPDLARSTFALFFVPKMDMVFDTPEDLTKILIEYEGMPPLRERFRKGMTYGDFSAMSANYYAKGHYS